MVSTYEVCKRLSGSSFENKRQGCQKEAHKNVCVSLDFVVKCFTKAADVHKKLE